ncbi:rhodanese-like domain-containing protein 7 isoform X1 [Vigna umbellata]|uniref:rhodanese-like domain-containing protein 7 isoform X1 n=1 Tax=Vigna umbellata TaxID=87088 RepID=UPI001F5EDC2C|nr:rhodanese-like domain-containing protein 7 isoform X1 [Vigna umbellata]
MEAYPNAASMLRSRTIIPPLPPLLALSARLPSPSQSPLLSPSVTPSEATLSCSGTPKPSFHSFSLFSNSHTLQTMTLSKCFSHIGPTVPIPDPPGSEPEPDSPLVVVSFYKFADFPDHALMRSPLKQLCQRLRVSGGIILAPEGINGSICGTRESVEAVLAFVQGDDRLKGLRRVESPVGPEEEAIHHGHSAASPLAAGEDAPFRWDHVRVKLKKEIVTLGMPTVSPIERVGKYVGPEDWNALINDPDTVVIDVRNNYETRIGKFKGAVDPCTTSFREFPSWVEERFQLSETDDGKNPKVEVNNSVQPAEKEMENQKQHMPRVAMYCTGGIRCEKATSLLLSKGFKEVYHLEGGILKYLEEVPETESLWEGECFVFDKRVSVEHGLVPGNFKLCYGCKQPVSDADMEAPEFEYGVSCPHCFALKSDEEKERARARQRQFERWGIIGGPDKGRRPTTQEPESLSRNPNQLSRSI